MTKQELKNICDNVSDEILKSEYTPEKILKKLSVYSEDGKTISTEGEIMFTLFESQNYAENLVYHVLCKVLNAG